MKEVEETISSVGVCDICGKDFNYKPGVGEVKVANYYHIVTGHYDWGNDSRESVKSRDACCDGCLSKFIQDWLRDKDVACSNTAYIQINKERHNLKEKQDE